MRKQKSVSCCNFGQDWFNNYACMQMLVHVSMNRTMLSVSFQTFMQKAKSNIEVFLYFDGFIASDISPSNKASYIELQSNVCSSFWCMYDADPISSVGDTSKHTKVNLCTCVKKRTSLQLNSGCRYHMTPYWRKSSTTTPKNNKIEKLSLFVHSLATASALNICHLCAAKRFVIWGN